MIKGFFSVYNGISIKIGAVKEAGESACLNCHDRKVL
ncbi:N-acetylglucosaminyl transferase [Bacillus sp. NRRL B-14911]|uniref:Uncharacterized protein n=1 Tax=Bacillus infantis NRRL B-14911 TaxID=1367477 RepID=U5L908_9BACI|nr:hypothetical protein N288_12060 [Bacillus infantis NRRL B-14911]EAR66981.1 N-acetylglucosaminyl transferase [Bacillus sp. NRRL B-14911]